MNFHMVSNISIARVLCMVSSGSTDHRYQHNYSTGHGQSPEATQAKDINMASRTTQPKDTNMVSDSNAAHRYGYRHKLQTSARHSVVIMMGHEHYHT